jgi:putative phosphonate metabolism protein
MIPQRFFLPRWAMSARFAIYLVPSSGSALWERGCLWLGRDPESGASYTQPAVPGFAADEILAITHSPRTYGFHGTLKAPFRLGRGVDEGELLDRVGRLAAALPAVAMPELRVDRLNGFLALVPAGASTAVEALAAQCVTRLDAVRAPLEFAERERRLSSNLTPRQQKLLEQWGYPYVLEEFQFHMTVSGPVDSGQADRLQPWIEQWFAPALAAPSAPADIAVFVQPAPGAEFALRRRFGMKKA